MKNKLETSILVIVLVLDMYLLCLNMNTKRYTSTRTVQSTANYVEVVNSEEYIVEDILPKHEEVLIQDPIVYDGLTLNELSDKIKLETLKLEQAVG